MANALKVEAMNKEEARINAMRERGELRRDRFLNARNRTIGVSTFTFYYFSILHVHSYS
jgi:hypothetical protein